MGGTKHWLDYSNILKRSIAVSFLGDGTRLGGKEMFVASLEYCDTGQACWAPPMVA